MTSVLGLRRKNKDVQNITLGLDGLRLSALTRASIVSKSVTDVTLGPNSGCADCNLNNNRNEGICELGAKNRLSPSVTNQFSVKRYTSNVAKNINMNSSGGNIESVESIDRSSLPIMKQLFDLNHQRQKRVKDIIKERFWNMEEDSQIRLLELYSKHQYLQHEIQAKTLQDEQLIVHQLQEDEIRSNQRQQQLAQEHKQHAQRINELNEKIKEAERRKEAEQEEKKRIKERKTQLDKMHQYQLECRTAYEQIVEVARQCKDRQALVGEVSYYTTELKSLNADMDHLISKCKTSEISDLDLHSASEIIQRVDEILGVIREVSANINERHDKAAVEASMAKQEDEMAQAAPSSQPTQAVTSSKTSEDLDHFVDKESFDTYRYLQQLLHSVENSYENLQKDDRLKKFRFECQKAVNIPVNAISQISAEHLQDKLFTLSRLISGQSVKVVHGEIVASSHPEGIMFCKNLLAKKFVWQGEHCKPEIAFAIAAVIEALWADFPDFGQLILGHFYRECPYLVPIFMPQVEGQSNEDYYKLLGYRYNENGEVEKQDIFLKRMSGIMRLYAAVLITRPCRYQQNKSHPHGLSQAWRWVSCILNMNPRPDICATLLCDFLEVAGSAMYCHYGQQFQKLLHLICKEYFPKIEKVTPSVSSGPVSRLEAFLQKILKEGHIPPPVGLLPPNFW